MCENQVLLGLQDEEILDKDNDKGLISWQTNKIGGLPNWMPCLSTNSNPNCKNCKKRSVLVLQVYSPLGKSSYHRTLYIFCCIQPTCWNKSESWQVLRSQWQDLTVNACNTSTPHDVNSDIWLDEAEDWGDCDASMEDNAFDNLELGDNSRKAGSKRDECFSRNVESASSGIEDLSISDSSPLYSSENKVQFMDDEKNVDSFENKCIIPEDLTLPSNLALPNFNQAKNYFSIEDINFTFIPHYISVIEEPESDSKEDIVHAECLLTDYERQTGNAFLTMHKKENDVSHQNTERYEKTEVKHGDKIFHKFVTRLTRCPQQIIRYQWQGHPLNMTLSDNVTPACQYCGSPRIFEMQLMPYLSNCLHLRGIGKEESTLDFGTVAISSCLKSCWREGDTIKEEYAYLQSDPDRALYERISQRDSGTA